MKIPKRKSKRTPVRLRHKIEKKSAAKQRKERRHEKKHPELHHKKKNSEAGLGIPNSFPYKDQILAEIEETRRHKLEEQARRREEARLRRKEAQAGDDDDMEMMDLEDEGDDSDSDSEDGMEVDSDEEEQTGNSAMAALLASARARAMEYEEQHAHDSDNSDANSDSAPIIKQDTSRRAFDKAFKDVIQHSDVILYVLDARDPDGTRSREVERQIMAADNGEKRLILILNKIDLVPPAVLKGWLTYLRRFFPTLPLKASKSAPNARSFDHKNLTSEGTSSALLKALKSFAHAKQLKRSVTVGVIGYPNVGKSSVINALTGRLGGSSSACPTGAEAGLTTSLREVKLDKKLKLLDSPGIVFPGSAPRDAGITKAEAHARLVLMNAIPPKQIDDPISAVRLLLKRFSSSQSLMDKLFDVYSLPPLVGVTIDQMTRNFLIEVARRRGRLGKKGVPNLESAAMTVIMDWRDGRIQGWIDPPVGTGAGEVIGGIVSDTKVSEEDQKEVVSEWLEEFKIEGLFGNGEVADEMELDQ